MQLILEFQPVAGAYRMCTFPVVRKLYRDTIGPDRPVRSVAVRKIYRTELCAYRAVARDVTNVA